MDDAGYRGRAEVEIFSEHWWAQDADHVLATLRERYRTAC
jgi:hypothetical protein